MYGTSTRNVSQEGRNCVLWCVCVVLYRVAVMICARESHASSMLHIVEN